MNRREFLRTVAYAGIATAAAPVARKIFLPSKRIILPEHLGAATNAPGNRLISPELMAKEMLRMLERSLMLDKVVYRIESNPGSGDARVRDGFLRVEAIPPWEFYRSE